MIDCYDICCEKKAPIGKSLWQCLELCGNPDIYFDKEVQNTIELYNYCTSLSIPLSSNIMEASVNTVETFSTIKIEIDELVKHEREMKNENK